MAKIPDPRMARPFGDMVGGASVCVDDGQVQVKSIFSCVHFVAPCLWRLHEMQ